MNAPHPRRFHDRRRFLRSAGGVLALPFFESLFPREALAQQGPLSFVYIFWPLGAYMPQFTPTGRSSLAALGASEQGLLPELARPLFPVRANVNVLSNFRNPSGDLDGAGHHARSAGCFLSCARLAKVERNERAGRSVDQRVADLVAAGTPVRSLNLGVMPNSGGDSGYSSLYLRTISWESPDKAAPRLTDLGAIRDALTGKVGGGAVSVPQNLLTVDAVKEQTDALRKSLRSGADLRKLQEFEQALFDIERRVKAAAGDGAVAGACAAEPPAPSLTAPRAAEIFRLARFALECNVTRVITVMLGNEGGSGHTDSHHQEAGSPEGNAQRLAAYKVNAREYIKQTAAFIASLRDARDANGASLLDRTVVVAGSGLGDGQAHDTNDLPVIMAGTARGRIATGRHILMPEKTNISNLWLTTVRLAGGGDTSFADSTGAVTL